jgi:hypothetical protein
MFVLPNVVREGTALCSAKKVHRAGRIVGQRRDPDFLYAALDRTACAAFIEESRMNFPNANQLDRKSGGNCDFPVAGASQNSAAYY